MKPPRKIGRYATTVMSRIAARPARRCRRAGSEAAGATATGSTPAADGIAVGVLRIASANLNVTELPASAKAPRPGFVSPNRCASETGAIHAAGAEDQGPAGASAGSLAREPARAGSRSSGRHRSSWAVPGSETAPGPGRSPVLSTDVLKVGGTQKMLTSVEA